MTFQLNDHFDFAPSAWIAPSAVILGHVSLGANSSVWFQCLLRGDCDQIVIGADCNLQDGSLLHNMAGSPVLIGDRVSFGHGVLAHGCRIASDVLVGIRATILNGVEIGDHCLIAAGSLIPENRVIPPYSLVMGNPAKVVREVDDRHLAMIRDTAAHYVDYARQYKQVLPAWQPLVKCQ
ncbi:MAG: gamma carbonic anhydrase family protein [Candidatus Melainabacteria bacterium HGW-Melainabacteria-1]|nr:MAG: gamma carbonic anhydrase family protein [Candidatus Melainabacteria bacterium HGW-Melainabacteria-1]